jgi:two-component system NtrC family sensor kinase
LRRRSLLLFLGVFVLGTMLSAGLATRFTRPIRQLDAGIRRLSDGDLDVEVPVAGRDEVARLGDAFNDMTRKLRSSRDRSRELVRREKLSALGGLAAGVAHDVRNPLHSIGLTLAHLADTCRPDDGERAGEFDRAVGIIRGEIRRLDQLVGNFLRFSRSERRERQPVDLADLLRETARLIAKEAEWRRIEVSVDLLETAPSVSADAETLRASLLNLVMNSFHAMPEGGKLALRLWIEREELVVEVADTGCGIPAEDLERVFEFAYTTREGGNGLGLAMVHECVVEEHGGRVDLDSEVGRGTTVRLALPIRPHQREEA